MEYLESFILNFTNARYMVIKTQQPYICICRSGDQTSDVFLSFKQDILQTYINDPTKSKMGEAAKASLSGTALRHGGSNRRKTVSKRRKSTRSK